MPYIKVKMRYIVLWSLAAICMLGQSTRMIYQGVFHPGSFYQPNTIDLLFDWSTMLIVGLALFSFVIIQFYHMISKKDDRGLEEKKRHWLPLRH